MDKIKKYLQTNRTLVRTVLKVFVWAAVVTLFILILSPLIIFEGVGAIENNVQAPPILVVGAFMLLAAPYLLIPGGLSAGLMTLLTKSKKNKIVLSVLCVLCFFIAYIMLSNPAFH